MAPLYTIGIGAFGAVVNTEDADGREGNNLGNRCETAAADVVVGCMAGEFIALEAIRRWTPADDDPSAAGSNASGYEDNEFCVCSKTLTVSNG